MIIALPVFGGQNFYGNIEYGYAEDQFSSDSDYDSTRSSFTQNYMLGFRDYIYSPKLLKYDLQYGIAMNDLKTDNGDYTTSANSKNSTYRTDLSFLNSSDYPFTLSAEKTSSPYSSSDSIATLTTNQTSERYGINGSLRTRSFDLSYALDTSTMDRTDPYSVEVRDNQNFRLNISKQDPTSGFRVSLSEFNRNYIRDDKYSAIRDDWSDRGEEIRADYTWHPNKEWNIGTNGSYYTSSYSDLSTVSAGGNVQWRPNDKFIASGLLFGSKMSAAGNDYTNFNAAFNSMYMITPELSTNQSVSYFQSNSDNYVSKLTMVSAGGTHTKQFENNLIVSTSASLVARMQQLTNELNSTANSDLTSYGTTIGTNVSKQFGSSNTRVFAAANYYVLSGADDTVRFSGNMGISDNYGKFGYSVSGFYTREETTINLPDTEETQVLEMESVGMDSSVRYNSSIGFQGQFSSNAGVTYSRNRYTDLVTTRLYPHADISFNYQLMDSLMWTSGANVSRDMSYDLTNYGIFLGINYQLRSVTIVTGAKMSVSSGADIPEMINKNLFIRASRPF
ncbi:hypothetical protein [Sulfuricurvum sp.]|uniref:hypothetical protein n=1 Tax=Sulfuricurvum sp. TaxID=2025608 RepID=UPI0026176C9B|nr:hypothetical protein [Sulfuricurvum sp.]